MSDLASALAGAIQSRADGEGRYFGFLYGRVTDVRDPQNLGRVRIHLFGQQDGEDADWVVPAWPGSIESVPRVGDRALVGFIDGDPGRPFYLTFAESGTRNRPTEAMVLGITFARMYNDLVDKYNTLIGHLYTAVTGFQALYNTHTHPETGVTTSPPNVPFRWTDTSPGSAAKVKAADGSTPSSLSTSEIVLSGEAKVR